MVFIKLLVIFHMFFQVWHLENLVVLICVFSYSKSFGLNSHITHSNLSEWVFPMRTSMVLSVDPRKSQSLHFKPIFVFNKKTLKDMEFSIVWGWGVYLISITFSREINVCLTHHNMQIKNQNPKFQNPSLKSLEMRVVESLASRVGNRNFHQPVGLNFRYIENGQKYKEELN